MHEAKKGSPVNIHKQCEIIENELREKLKESERLSQATFEHLNARIVELKAALKNSTETGLRFHSATTSSKLSFRSESNSGSPFAQAYNDSEHSDHDVFNSD